jgi:antitoxin ParD1/3/4
MNLTLPPEQQKWLEAQVAAGTFASVEAAAEAAIAAVMAGHAEIEADDLEWAAPYVDAARIDVARGDVLTLDEHKARMAARIDALKR